MTDRDFSSFRTILKVVGGFLLSGSFLFFHVWWPIQAERSLGALKKMHAQVSEKKAELNILNLKYASLTSLTALDQWAKTHGPWKVPASNDIITIEQ